MKKMVLVAPVSSDSDLKVLFSPLKEFPFERIIMLSLPDGLARAHEFSKEIEKIGLSPSIFRIKSGSNPWEDFFVSLAEAIQGFQTEKVIINVSTADRISQCALTNAAHVNGIKAVAILNGEVSVLPILKLSYGTIIQPSKMKILEELKTGCIPSMEELSEKTGMSLQLTSYHVKGTQKSKGLVDLELVEVKTEKGRQRVCLTTLGRLLMRGYIGS